jgi:H/ACA ribonucleoprotein complex non-core subunit NAF1
LDDLPPVPDLSALTLNVKEEECIHMGHIESIVDKLGTSMKKGKLNICLNLLSLVMVQALPNIPAYNIDTFLFLDNGKKPLGQVYDVLGPVTCPMYVIRFNSVHDIELQGLKKSMKVFSAPKTEHTHYVFLKQLMKYVIC